MKRKMQIELLPCPFCDGKDIDHESMAGARWLRCQSCSASGSWIWADKLPKNALSDPDFQNIWALETERAWNNRPDGFSAVDSVKRVDVESDFDICECGHSRKDHSRNSDGDTACYHRNDLGHYDTCTEFTLRATIAHDEPATMCHCGHDGYIHGEDGVCLHWDKVHYCSCNKYTPIPAVLHGEQINLFDTDK